MVRTQPGQTVPTECSVLSVLDTNTSPLAQETSWWASENALLLAPRLVSYMKTNNSRTSI